jgi:hypothetical protein
LILLHQIDNLIKLSKFSNYRHDFFIRPAIVGVRSNPFSIQARFDLLVSIGVPKGYNAKLNEAQILQEPLPIETHAGISSYGGFNNVLL